jgi:hypothetical protein
LFSIGAKTVPEAVNSGKLRNASMITRYAVAWHIERYDALTANRRENTLLLVAVWADSADQGKDIGQTLVMSGTIRSSPG